MCDQPGNSFHPRSNKGPMMRLDWTKNDIRCNRTVLTTLDVHAAGAPGQTVGWTCQAIDAIRVSTSARVIGCSPRTLKCWIVKDAITIA